MAKWNRWFFAATIVVAACAVCTMLYAQDKPLGEKDLLSLIQLQIDDAAIVAKLQKGGVSFVSDDATLGRLKAAGASEAVVKAVQAAASAKPSSGGAPITYPDVLQLLSLGIDEAAILQRLQKSPTTFTPSAEQVAELKKAGASDKLLAALRVVRPISPQAAELITDFAIVLDCSGSMKDLTPEGETKMVAAKRVVTDLVQKMPDGLNVMFVIYGHEVFGSADDPRNCQAVKIARPLSRLDAAGKSDLGRLIDGLRPTGATPIALSLRTAGAELARNNAFCGLVLITDGLETCHGDPVAEAATLAANSKLTFGVNVVGFGVKAEENQILAQIAKAGRGKYYAANSSAELAKSIGAVFQDLAQNTRKPDVQTIERRAVKVLKPEIEGFPPLAEIQLVSYGLGSVSVVAKGGYGEEIRVPSPTTKYDVKFAPKTEGALPVAMLADHVFPDRKLLVIKPEDYLGLVRVNGSGQLKSVISVYKRGLGSIVGIQESKKFGEIMVVPAGKYYVSVDGNDIEEGFVVEPGKLHVLE